MIDDADVANLMYRDGDEEVKMRIQNGLAV